MGIEIERKFLVKHDVWQQTVKPEPVAMRQGYIVNAPDKTLRLRIAGLKAYLTFKTGTQGISRAEFEYPLPAHEATELYSQFVDTGLEKHRYNIHYRGKLWEVDVFSGENEGLIVAEIELASEDETFDLPPWVDHEVSGDPRYYNSSLSVKPYKSW